MELLVVQVLLEDLAEVPLEMEILEVLELLEQPFLLLHFYLLLLPQYQ